MITLDAFMRALMDQGDTVFREGKARKHVEEAVAVFLARYGGREAVGG